jgi:Zn-dependent peptidase ImmA (M78 family)
MAFLTKDDQRRIDGIIDSLGQKLGVSYPENSLLELAERAGIKIIETDLHAIRPGLSGAIMYDDPKEKTNPVIYIHNGIPAGRKTFTLAHELGHHFLHESDKLRLDDLDYSNDDKDTYEESQANYFAASLLVPKDLLNKKIKDGLKATELADYFQVSIPVIRNRIKWIKVN